MRVENLQRNWEEFGAPDPMRAVLTTEKTGGKVWKPDEFYALGRAQVDQWMARLKELDRPATGERALDFGCGAGRLTQALAQYYSEVVGVDVSRPMLAVAQEHNAFSERVRFVHNTRGDLAIFSTGTFDLVVSEIVLQHLEPFLAKQYLTEFLRLARPGGTVVFQVPVRRTARRLRYAIFTRFPWLFRSYRRLRYGPAPHMEMYAISPTVIEHVVHAGGGRIIAADGDTTAVNDFDSRTYYVAVER